MKQVKKIFVNLHVNPFGKWLGKEQKKISHLASVYRIVCQAHFSTFFNSKLQQKIVGQLVCWLVNKCLKEVLDIIKHFFEFLAEN